MRCLVLFLILAPLSIAETLVKVPWVIDSTRADGVESIGFPMTITDIPDKPGYTLTQQFDFVGPASTLGTIQVKPVGGDGETASQIIFAITGKSIKQGPENKENCKSHADGITCRLDLKLSYPLNFKLTIAEDVTTWEVTYSDDEDRFEYIGSFQFPSTIKDIKPKGFGSISYTPEKGDDDFICESVPYADISFGVPEPLDPAELEKPTEVGKCEGRTNFMFQKEGTDGEFEEYQMTFGVKGM